MLKQRAQTTKAHKISPCTYACSPWTSANPGHKPVRLVSKTGQTGFTQQTTPPKAKNAKEMHKLPLDSWDRFQGSNVTFLHLPFSTLLPMHESRLKIENMQPRASQVYKIHHRELHKSK
jgi:hypothetical protein